MYNYLTGYIRNFVVVIVVVKILSASSLFLLVICSENFSNIFTARRN